MPLSINRQGAAGEAAGRTSHSILLTIDVEDWFQVENFKGIIPFTTWDQRQGRAERNTHRLLDLLDAPPGFARSGTPSRATFFVLGWLARRRPELVREIHARGHEVASHGYGHQLCTHLASRDLAQDLLLSRKLLEDILGVQVCGYRAPSFSISDESLALVREAGYRYDSSYNSFALHGRYGRLNLISLPRRGIAREVADDFHELPLSNLTLGGRVLPWAGGGYFRLLPAPLYRAGMRRVLRREGAFVFYMHPWEIDPHQPQVSGLTPGFRLRHYLNLERTYSRLSRLIEAFPGCAFLTCRDYLTSRGVEFRSSSPITTH
jgi:polysaccharide deacetylase family protein (PEP-CTERM system associated)